MPKTLRVDLKKTSAALQSYPQGERCFFVDVVLGGLQHLDGPDLTGSFNSDDALSGCEGGWLWWSDFDDVGAGDVRNMLPFSAFWDVLSTFPKMFSHLGSLKHHLMHPEWSCLEAWRQMRGYDTHWVWSCRSTMGWIMHPKTYPKVCINWWCMMQKRERGGFGVCFHTRKSPWKLGTVVDRKSVV